MIRVSLQWVANCYAAIHDLKSLSEQHSDRDCYLKILRGILKLDEMYNTSVYVPYLRASLQNAADLRQLLDEARKQATESNLEVDQVTRLSLSAKAREFASVFESEIGVVPSFLITPKEGYDVNHLAENGQLLFPAATSQKVLGVEYDMMEAGKALAFDLPTACGFHVFRVLEAVLKSYWDSVADGAKRPMPETIGKFAAELKEKELGDKRIWETLAQIAKLHRNPIIHPEIQISTEEAIETLGICRSAIGAMLRSIPELQD